MIAAPNPRRRSSASRQGPCLGPGGTGGGALARCVALGGFDSPIGAVVGGLVMGIAEVLVTGYLSPTYRDAIAFVLLIVILLVRPAGIFGKAVAEKV